MPNDGDDGNPTLCIVPCEQTPAKPRLSPKNAIPSIPDLVRDLLSREAATPDDKKALTELRKSMLISALASTPASGASLKSSKEHTRNSLVESLTKKASTQRVTKKIKMVNSIKGTSKKKKKSRRRQWNADGPLCF